MSLIGTFIIAILIASIPFGITFFVAWKKQIKRNNELMEINDFLINRHAKNILEIGELKKQIYNDGTKNNDSETG